MTGPAGLSERCAGAMHQSKTLRMRWRTRWAISGRTRWSGSRTSRTWERRIAGHTHRTKVRRHITVQGVGPVTERLRMRPDGTVVGDERTGSLVEGRNTSASSARRQRIAAVARNQPVLPGLGTNLGKADGAVPERWRRAAPSPCPRSAIAIQPRICPDGKTSNRLASRADAARRGAGVSRAAYPRPSSRKSTGSSCSSTSSTTAATS